MIWLGVEAHHRFEWVLYVFGAFLVFTGVRMLFTGEQAAEPGKKSPSCASCGNFSRFPPNFDGQKFLTRLNGRMALTPLALVLVLVETTDLIFAVDSIPAIFAVTRAPSLSSPRTCSPSSACARCISCSPGRSAYFRYLKVGLSVVLVFIGVKMLH